MAEAGLCRRNRHLHAHSASRHRPIASRPGWRLLTLRAEGFDSTGDKVLEFDSAVLVKVELSSASFSECAKRS